MTRSGTTESLRDDAAQAQQEIERGVLGGLIWHPDDVWKVGVEARHFRYVANAVIFEAIAGIAATGKKDRIDVSVLRDEVRRRGGDVTLADLYHLVDDDRAIDVRSRAAMLVEAWSRRTAQLYATQLQGKLATAGLDVGEVVAEHVRNLQALLTGKTETYSVNYGEAMLSRAVEILTRERGQTADVKTGFWKLDLLTGGLPRPGSTIIGGRPSRGKSVLMRTIAEQVARQRKGIVLFCTPEQATPEVMDRALAAECSIELRSLRQRLFDDHAQERLLHVGQRIGDLRNLFIFDKPNMTTRDVCDYAHSMALAGDVQLIVVDYLQYMRDRARGTEKRHEVVGRIGRDLKELGKELNAAVLLGSQLGREAEGVEVPSLEHLRESGDLEQDADVVLLLGGTFDPDKEKTSVFIAKQRSGPIGSLNLVFERRYVRMHDAEDPDLPGIPDPPPAYKG